MNCFPYSSTAALCKDYIVIYWYINLMWTYFLIQLTKILWGKTFSCHFVFSVATRTDMKVSILMSISSCKNEITHVSNLREKANINKSLPSPDLPTIHAWSHKAYAYMILSVCSVTTTWSLNLVRSEYTLQFTFKAAVTFKLPPPPPPLLKNKTKKQTQQQKTHKSMKVQSLVMVIVTQRLKALLSFVQFATTPKRATSGV